ncbi:MAG: thioredoxin family protein [Gemmatimonadaceae bacterium]
MPNVIAAPIVDLIFDVDCPNVDEARTLLRTALTETGYSATWREWDREAPETPAALRGLGSPTILVNGTDVSGGADSSAPADRANCCRVYRNGERLRGVPALSTVILALRRF